MGVAAFFRWLTEKFPKITSEVLEKRCAVVNGQGFPVDLTQPNPNLVEYDNLYVDMNGLIHPCSHPEDRETPATEAEMYVNVTKYVDRLFAAIRPRRLLFLAIDGVAPRAKMNQQRSRRFRAAQDAQERAKVMQDVLTEMQDKGMDAPPGHTGEWDSNVITPGTEFMSRLSTYLWFYILDRMNNDAQWRSIKVILSDASEPGEGEHKIMKFVRDERAMPGYDPNQSHVLHGLDADLIMLALATHELHFNILREKIFFNKRDKESKQGKISEAQQLLDSQTKASLEKGAILASCLNPQDEWIYGKGLELLQVSVLREYLQYEFRDLEPAVPFGYDFERVIDDFIFMCFFVGNDFLPHLPSLDIRDGALDYLMEVYRDILPSLGDYLTSSGGVLNLTQVDVLLARVGEVEDDVFQRRKSAEEYRQGGRERLQNERNGYKGMTGAKASAEQCKKLLAFAPTLNNMMPLSRKQETGAVPPPPPVLLPPPVAEAAAKQISKASVAENRSAAANLKKDLLGSKRKAAAAGNAAPAEEQEEAQAELGDAPCKRARPASPTTSTAASTTTTAREGDAESDVEDNDDDDDDDDEGDAVPPAVVSALAARMTAKLAHSTPTLPAAAGGDAAPGSGTAAAKAISTAVVNADKATELHRKEEVARRLKALENEKIETLKTVVTDEIKFHERGWKSRYYDDTFKKEDIEKGGGLQKMCHAYVQGLVWVLKYYYEGCPSWSWYYPFHYAPFASDLRNIESYPIAPALEIATPFRPVEQLLAVLPKESVHALPKECQWLMTSRESPLEDVYDGDVPLDPNGKQLPWLWVLLLPFVDEARITAAFQGVVNNLTLDERRRNAWGKSLIFLHNSHPLVTQLVPAEHGLKYQAGPETDTEVLKALAYEAAKLRAQDGEEAEEEEEEEEKKPSKGKGKGKLSKGKVKKGSPASCAQSAASAAAQEPISLDFDCTAGNGICGRISQAPPKSFCPLNMCVAAPKNPPRAFTNIENNAIQVYTFDLPQRVAHRSVLLPGGVEAQRVLTQADVTQRRIPRLNRGGASIVDLAQKFRRQDQIQSHQPPPRGGYQPGYASNSAQYANQHTLHQQNIAAHHAQQQFYQTANNRDARQRGPDHGATNFQAYQQQQVHTFSDKRGGVQTFSANPSTTGSYQNGRYMAPAQPWAPGPRGMAGLSRAVPGQGGYPGPGLGQQGQQEQQRPYNYGMMQQQQQQQPRGLPAHFSHSAPGGHAPPPSAGHLYGGRPPPPGGNHLQAMQQNYRPPQVMAYGHNLPLPPPPPQHMSAPPATSMLSIQSMRESLARTLNKQ